jgi:hypothetical protein
MNSVAELLNWNRFVILNGENTNKRATNANTAAGVGMMAQATQSGRFSSGCILRGSKLHVGITNPIHPLLFQTQRMPDSKLKSSSIRCFAENAQILTLTRYSMLRATDTTFPVLTFAHLPNKDVSSAKRY